MILSFNIRSLAPKFHQFIMELNDSSPEVICLNETWLKPSITSNLVMMDGYSILRQDRYQTGDTNFRPGGGVCAYVKNPLNTCILSQFCYCTHDLEVLSFEIKPPDCRKLIIVNIYRPPTGNCAVACELLRVICSDLINYNRRLDFLMVGDINIDSLTDSPNSRLLNDLCTEFGLTSHINIPTRVCLNSKSSIDIILSKMNHVSMAGIISNSLSDHYPTFIVKKKTFFFF